eukprot:scaffold3340_cov114-Isochrysis_galbana.AAC.12
MAEQQSCVRSAQTVVPQPDARISIARLVHRLKRGNREKKIASMYHAANPGCARGWRRTDRDGPGAP